MLIGYNYWIGLEVTLLKKISFLRSLKKLKLEKAYGNKGRSNLFHLVIVNED